MTEPTLLDTQMPTQLEWRCPEDVGLYAQNARTHSRRQLRQIADSIKRFGFTNPVLIGDADEIIAGHGRVAAAKMLHLEQVPVLRLSHLNAAERRAYILVDNRLAEKAGWDQDILAVELQALIDLDFDVELTGFENAEIDIILDPDDGIASPPDRRDELPVKVTGQSISKPGDLWALGPHRLMCGDAQDRNVIERLMGGHQADMIFTDPPYNVPIDGHVTGKGTNTHREFAFASGEMSHDAFVAFLTNTLGNAASVCRDGAIAFICMDWRHMGDLLAAGQTVFSDLKNLCVWNKTNAGMGTFYRSKHELVFVYKVGIARHTNNFELGETGRYRTNVWDYAGVNVPSAESREALSMHPTVKPVSMIVDAVKDCSHRGGRVLDVFAGSGSTLIAADSCGRIAHVLEYDPLYCDTVLDRYMRLTGNVPVRQATGARWDTLRQEMGRQN